MKKVPRGHFHLRYRKVHFERTVIVLKTFTQYAQKKMLNSLSDNEAFKLYNTENVVHVAGPNNHGKAGEHELNGKRSVLFLVLVSQ